MALSRKKSMWNNPLGLRVLLFHTMFFKLNKDLYELKQAPTAWYKHLITFLVKKCF